MGFSAFLGMEDDIPASVKTDDRAEDAVSKILTEIAKPVQIESVEELKSIEALESGHNIDISAGRQEISVWGFIRTESGEVSAFNKIALFSLVKRKAYRALSDESGYFSFENVVPARDYLIRVTPYGMYQQYIRYPVNLDSTQTALTIDLKTLNVASLKGEIVDRDNRPVSEFGIKVKNAKKSQWSATTISDSVGRFIIENVPIGELDISSTYGQPLWVTGYLFSGEPDQSLKLIVDRGENHLNGQVYDQFNNVVVDANVVLEWTNKGSGMNTFVNRHALTDALGKFSISGIGREKYDLEVLSNGEIVHQQSVDIDEDGTDLIIVLTVKP